MTNHYKATVYFDSEEDIYQEGQQPNTGNSWSEELTADTKEELITKIEDITYSKSSTWADEQINDYDWATEYFTSYLADKEGYEASELDIKAWKDGLTKLWGVNCHILVSYVTESKVGLLS